MMRGAVQSQSPSAYDQLYLQGAQIASRMALTTSKPQTESLRAALGDTGYRFRIHPSETAKGLTAANLSFGLEVGDPMRYGALFDNTADDTAAWTKAGQVSAHSGLVVRAGYGGTSKITGNVPLDDKTQIVGNHRHQYTAGGSIINFAPTVANTTLFSPSGAPAAFRFGYCIEGLLIMGNSVSAAGNSGIAIDCHGWNKSTVRNVGITGFRTGIRCYATINNNFDFVQIQNCYIQNILYDGGLATTDTWYQTYMGNSPIGVQTNGSNLAIRFIAPVFESITTYGMNIVKESYGFQVFGGYSEDIATANLATNAMFRVSFDGTTLQTAGYQLSVYGGRWQGRNAGGVGACLRVDATDGVYFAPDIVGNWTYGVETTANTLTQQVVLGPWSAAGVGTQVSDESKVQGEWPAGNTNSASRNGLNAAFRQIAFLNSPSTPLNDYREYTSTSAACTGAITTAAIWKVVKVGKQVTLTLPAINGNSAAGQPFFEFGEAMSGSFAPLQTVVFPCVIRDNGATLSTPGMILVNTSGGIRVYRDMNGTTNYTNATNVGLGQGAGASVSWMV